MEDRFIGYSIESVLLIFSYLLIIFLSLVSVKKINSTDSIHVGYIKFVLLSILISFLLSLIFFIPDFGGDFFRDLVSIIRFTLFNLAIALLGYTVFRIAAQKFTKTRVSRIDQIFGRDINDRLNKIVADTDERIKQLRFLSFVILTLISSTLAIATGIVIVAGYLTGIDLAKGSKLDRAESTVSSIRATIKK